MTIKLLTKSEMKTAIMKRIFLKKGDDIDNHVGYSMSSRGVLQWLCG